MQDIEFTVEDGTLYFLQTRPAKRTPQAALRVLIDLVREGLIGESEGAERAAGIDFDAASLTRFEGEATAIATGTPASAGVASGKAVFDSARAGGMCAQGDGPVILVRPDTSTADVAGFAVVGWDLDGKRRADGSRRRGRAPARQGLRRGLHRPRHRRGGKAGENRRPCHHEEGDWLSIDGESGEVFPGERRIITSRPEAEIAEIGRWKRRVAGS